MSLGAERLALLASETGFRAGMLEKVDRLIGLVDDITRHPRLSRVLALKGGTALNLGFGTPSRLSADLDYNYIGFAGREEMLRERPGLEQALQRIVGPYLKMNAEAESA